MKRKGRRHLPKVPDGIDTFGTVPLGQDPPIGPYGPMGQIRAVGVMARAWRWGTPRQRRAAAVLLAVMAAPLVWNVIGMATSS